jgi:hypothetical protein
MESDLNDFNLLTHSENNASSSILASSSTTHLSESNFTYIESFTESDNFIKLEPKSHGSLDDDQCFNSTNIFDISTLSITPPDSYEELLQVYPNKLPVYQNSPSPPMEVSLSNSSSSLSLPININSNNYFNQENYANSNMGIYDFSNTNCDQDSGQVQLQFTTNNNFSTHQQTPQPQQQKFYNQSYQYHQQQPQHVINQYQRPTSCFQNESQQYQNHYYNCNISACSNNVSNINFTVNQNSYVSSNICSKQDVSVGTDLSICKDLRCEYLMIFN